MEAMKRYYNEMSDFVDDTGKAIKAWSDSLTGKSDNPDDYLPRKHLKQIEDILVYDPRLADELVKMGEQLRKNNDENRRKELVLAYAPILEEIFMNKKKPPT